MLLVKLHEGFFALTMLLVLGYAIFVEVILGCGRCWLWILFWHVVCILLS
jgi:hypothetical protein